jgi:hypothetical protein
MPKLLKLSKINYFNNWFKCSSGVKLHSSQLLKYLILESFKSLGVNCRTFDKSYLEKKRLVGGGLGADGCERRVCGGRLREP